MTQRHHAVAVAFALLLVCSASCDNSKRVTPRADATAITGAGATFPYPVYSRWFSDYFAETGTRINYFSVGSTDGVAMLLADSVDFGATDIPLADSQLVQGSQVRFAQVPMVMGAVVVAFNLPGVAQLNLDADALAGLLLGRIRKWNDAALQKLNPGLKLPAIPVTVVHRDDLSGTTIVLDSYLRRASKEWARSRKPGQPVQWAVGEGEHGNEGISGHLKATVGAVGYVPLAYAQLYRLSSAHLRNASGAFIAPSAQSVEATANAVLNAEAPDFRLSLIDTRSPDAYPIATATWLVFPAHATNEDRGRAVRTFIRWALARGASGASALGYAPLPPKVVAHFDSAVANMGNSTDPDR